MSHRTTRSRIRAETSKIRQEQKSAPVGSGKRALSAEGVRRLAVSRVTRRSKGKRVVKVTKTTPERFAEIKKLEELSVRKELSRAVVRGDIKELRIGGKRVFRARTPAGARVVSRVEAVKKRVVDLPVIKKLDRELELSRLLKGKILSVKGRVAVSEELRLVRRTPIQKTIEDIQLRQLDFSLTAKARRDKLKKTILAKPSVLKEFFLSRIPKSKREKGLVALGELLSRTEIVRTKALADLKEFKLTDVVIGRTPKESFKIITQRLGIQARAIRDITTTALVRGVSILPLLALEPKKTVVQQVKSLTVDLPDTVRNIKAEALRDPLGTLIVFGTTTKLLGVAGKILKRTPVGRFILKEKFIFGLPKEFRVPTRKILNAALAQRKLKPFGVKQLSKINFVKPKTMTSVEFGALLKVLKGKKVDSVVFGSAASRALSQNRTPLPKDLDIAVGSAETFVKEFIRNIPKSQRKNFVLRGQKLIKVSSGKALFDIKPLSRLTPDQSLFGRGFLPVSRIKKVFEFNLKDIKRGSFLPRLKRKIVPEFEVPTSPLQVFKGVKFVSFGEQTLRKALGTLQVLLEKNVRRAKDPKALLLGFEIQLRALRRSGSASVFTRGKINKLRSAIKLLKSKDFLNLFDKKIKAKIIKEFPIIGKFDSRKVKALFKGKKPLIVERGVVKVADLKRFELSELPSRLPTSRLPEISISRLPPSKLPSKVPSRLPSKLSKIPISRIPSVIPVSKLPSKIPPSKVPSRLPSKLSRIPISRLPPSKLPPSRIPVSKLPPSKIPPPPKVPPKIRVKPLVFKKFLKSDLAAFKPQVVKFTTTIVRPGKIRVNGLRLFTGAELR